ncbi:MAG: hypothetical protein L0154_00930 [Chloroflexi bacterium]|nr:hypothetical protein [Chloroflexota bacterium]
MSKNHLKLILGCVFFSMLLSNFVYSITRAQDDQKIIPITGFQIDGSNELMWLPDSTTLVVANDGGMIFVDIAELDSGEQSATAIRLPNAITTLAYDETGERLIGGDDAGHVLFYDIEDLENPVTLEADDFGIEAMAYDAENEWLATASASELIIWQGDPLEPLRSVELQPTQNVNLTFTDEKLILGTGAGIQVIDPTGEESTEMIGDADGGNTSMFLYDGWLFEGKQNGLVRVSHGDEAVGLWRGHSSTVTALVVAPEQEWLISGDEDGLLIIREINTRETIVEDTEHESAILSLSVNDLSTLLASLDDTGRIIIWEMTLTP